MTLQQLIREYASKIAARDSLTYTAALEIEADLHEFAEEVVRLSRRSIPMPQITGAPSLELYEALRRGQGSSR